YIHDTAENCSSCPRIGFYKSYNTELRTSTYATEITKMRPELSRTKTCKRSELVVVSLAAFVQAENMEIVVSVKVDDLAEKCKFLFTFDDFIENAKSDMQHPSFYLSKVLRQLGRSIGANPKTYIAVSVAVGLVLTSGVQQGEVEDDIIKLYFDYGSESKTAWDFIDRNFPVNFSAFLPDRFGKDSTHYTQISLRSTKLESPGWVIKNKTKTDLWIKDSYQNSTGVVQEFLQNPLLFHGRLFQIGVFVAVISIEPLRVYVYEDDASVSVCSEFYEPFDPKHGHRYIITEENSWRLSEVPEIQAKLKNRRGSVSASDKQILAEFFADQTNLSFVKIWTRFGDVLREWCSRVKCKSTCYQCLSPTQKLHASRFHCEFTVTNHYKRILPSSEVMLSPTLNNDAVTQSSHVQDSNEWMTAWFLAHYDKKNNQTCLSGFFCCLSKENGCSFLHEFISWENQSEGALYVFFYDNDSLAMNYVIRRHSTTFDLTFSERNFFLFLNCVVV
ncbi:unnamed protein product, partial [Notodromas monacha]